MVAALPKHEDIMLARDIDGKHMYMLDPTEKHWVGQTVRKLYSIKDLGTANAAARKQFIVQILSGGKPYFDRYRAFTPDELMYLKQIAIDNGIGLLNHIKLYPDADEQRVAVDLGNWC